MIDREGCVRCIHCLHKHALELLGRLVWYCPKCKTFQIDDTEFSPPRKEILDKTLKV
ncbi:hypothetical protein LCGC14_1955390 [marine sediment metagenome]|uniref:Uncharacterized protein n=1 Tax=marine sediment metagenome TaxID=412755 RepID=A0A0F9G4L8_9ZZZZ